MEKRASKRHGCEASVGCGYFNKEETCSARMLNYSEGGAYLECSSFFKERSIILIRLKQIVSGASEAQVYCTPREVSLGEVRWSREISDKNTSSFAIGIQYY
jgi:hypothetical protein